MKGQNLYLTYKKDTSRLLYWIINTSNGIIQSGKADGTGIAVNTTGQTTVTGMVGMAELIAKHLNPIPSAVFELLQGIIKARTTVYDAFQQSVSDTPDPEIEKSNATHKFFIDALRKAFDALGGKTWTSNVASVEAIEDVNLTLQNSFAALSLSHAQNEEQEAEDSDDEDAPQNQSRVQRKKGSKGKKGKRGKKSKPRQKQKLTADPAISEVPLESYRIIEDGAGLITEYLLAVYAVIGEWIQLRSFTQGLWREVAYEGLNSAVAASLTNSAVALIKQTCLAVFADFPGHELYDTIMQTITRGNLDKALRQFDMHLHRVSDDGKHTEKVQKRFLDVREQFWIHTYNDLNAFLDDFRKNGTGKPTKALQAHLNT